MRERDRRRAKRQAHDCLRAARKKEHQLIDARAVPRRRLRPGTVVWAHVPFDDGLGEKLRPAVVVGCEGRTVVLRKLTSSATRLRFDFYVDLEDLDAAGLDRACGVDLRSTVEVDVLELVDIAGELSVSDFVRLETSAAPRSRQALSIA